MTNSSLQDFELLKAAMGNTVFLRNINANEENQSDFLIMLETNKLTHQQILELVTLTQNEQVRSLLIMHLLSHQDYLTSLKGESILARLTNAETHLPSRLNALVHQVDIKILSEAVIDKLPPETAVSILCSVPHFHQFKEEQIESLLKKYPYPQVIIYWLNHYSSMPNAHFTLAHLMKGADTHISTELTKMNEMKREAIITNMIKHLELFNPATKILYEHNEEMRLILAIRLFLNGHHHKAYVTYINRLTDKLLLQNHQFSLQAVQLLISLHEKEEFTELTKKTAHLTNHYVRANAQAGEIGLFYQSGRVTIESMKQRIQLNASVPKTISPAKGFFANFLSTKKTEESKEQAAGPIPENTLVAQLAEHKKHVIALAYFLIHFKGDDAKISLVVNDYLNFYVQETRVVNQHKYLYPLADLIIRPELDRSIREQLFNCFLRYPDLYDEQISFILFLFDAKRTIQYFGLKGGEKNYTQVVNLCTWALRKLAPDTHQEMITIATTARSEALLELSFNQGNGFFARLFTRLKRCWVSGWTGFFLPNLPFYVAPVSFNISQDPVTSIEAGQGTQLLPYKSAPDLPTLLKEMTPPLTQDTLDELIEALNVFSLKTRLKNELEVRQKLHDLFQKLFEDGKETNKMDGWLMQNQPHLIANCIRLLELTLIQGSPTNALSLLKKIDDASPHLQQITRELTCSFPELLEEKTIVQNIPAVTESNLLETTLETTSELAYSAFNWAKSELGAFFKSSIPHPPPGSSEKDPSKGLVV
ncbi:hypothetical protein [Legionella maioricensis]|uniref:Dot/Icm secretion system substrate n=1 Tax=Legionella maioricensis TaxID=2896528 RepID=A0A9X2CZU2_9GAMM|nr:hypothetical protein [Legionella maioricensis]MCL9683217.1 hypothetical protein [Legionella maioricensis]MCL9686085.1 hypothetical protein [Legionella maioricensis]